MEENINIDVEALDTEMKEVPKKTKTVAKKKVVEPIQKTEDTATLVNPLRKERIIVRYIPKANGIWGNNPKHVLAGGLSENASITLVVPRLASGLYVNVLTDNEKAFLEDIMGLEYNALSIHKKVDNFWDDRTEGGINKVRLIKQDNYFDLSSPEDYIRYKILLANKDIVCPSLKELEDRPKATYRFVITSEETETKNAKLNMSATMQCYKEFGKYENDADTLSLIVSIITNKPMSSNSKIDFLQTEVNKLIQNNTKLFLKVITDPMLSTKVLLRKANEQGVISKRGDYYYLREDNSPLCEMNEEPTFNIAAKYLNNPKHQDILFALQSKIE